MPRAIICCDCPGVLPRARAAYTVHIKQPVPPIYEGRGAVSALADQLPQGTPSEQHIRALSRSKEKYAYYFEWDGAQITRKFNLLTGKEVA